MSVIATIIELVPTVFRWLLVVTLLALVPMAIFRRTRRLAGIGFLVTTPVYVLLLWISAAVSVYAYWGLAVLIVTTLFLGVPTLLAAIIATIMEGTGLELLALIFMTIVTVGSGITGMTLTEK